MKIRTGFVSNSSSSSFIIAGVMVETSKLDEDMIDELSENFEVKMYSEEGAPPGKCIIGTYVSRIDNDEGADSECISISSVTEKINDVLAALPDGLEIEFSGIMTGMEMC